MNETTDNSSLYYLSYGSNMSRSKISSRAKYESKSGQPFTNVYRAYVKNWRLTFDLPGLTPLEPCMGSMEPSVNDGLYGVVYEFTSRKDWEAFLRTEGINMNNNNRNSIAYQLIEVKANLTPIDDDDNVIENVTVHTLRTIPEIRLSNWKDSCIFPSKRYMNLLIEGATKENLPSSYITYLKNIPTARTVSRLEFEMLSFINPLLLFIFFTYGRNHFTMFFMRVLMKLSSKHEQIVLHTNENQLVLLQNIKLATLKAGMAFIVVLHIVPTILLFMFSKKTRDMYFQVRSSKIAERAENQSSPQQK